MTTNDITKDKLISKPANDKFRQEWDRIFGNTNKAKENNSATDSLPIRDGWDRIIGNNGLIDEEVDRIQRDVAGPDSRFPKDDLPVLSIGAFRKDQAC